MVTPIIAPSSLLQHFGVVQVTVDPPTQKRHTQENTTIVIFVEKSDVTLHWLLYRISHHLNITRYPNHGCCGFI